MSSDIIFTKETLDFYFKELAKEHKRLNGSKMKAECSTHLSLDQGA